MKRLTQCPACQSELIVTEYQCPECDITIRGHFAAGGLGTLTPEQENFVRVFLCAEGNIREVERRLKISYPTVKNRLAEITRVLCTGPATEPSDPGAHPALDELAEGRISVEEALNRISKGGRK